MISIWVVEEERTDLCMLETNALERQQIVEYLFGRPCWIERRETRNDRARALFGQSLASERYAVACNEKAYLARLYTLRAFEAREQGLDDILYAELAKSNMQRFKEISEAGVLSWRSSDSRDD